MILNGVILVPHRHGFETANMQPRGAFLLVMAFEKLDKAIHPTLGHALELSLAAACLFPGFLFFARVTTCAMV